jgi:predicted ATPase
MESNLITFIGAPGSGKSTLASSVHTKLKMSGKNSIFIGEEATDWIAEWGVPNRPIDQLTIFYRQSNREKMFLGSKEYIVCDSSGMLNYFYFRGLFKSPLESRDIAVINHLQKEILKTINQWSHIFYCPPIEVGGLDDGIRYHGEEEVKRIDRWIKSYLEIENIPHVDLTGVPIDERIDFVYNTLIYGVGKV